MRIATVTQMLYDVNRDHQKTQTRPLEHFCVVYAEAAPPTPKAKKTYAEAKLKVFEAFPGAKVIRRVK